jgi:hypothetical protein
MESTRMEWGGVTQEGRTRGASPTGRTPSQPVRSALHGHAQSWADEAGAREEAGRVMEPRHGERGGREESPPGGGAGKADGLHAPEGRSPGRARELQAFTAQVRALTGRPRGRPSGPIVQARRPRRLGWWAGGHREVPPYPESAVSIEWPFSVGGVD